ncbi:PD-(D/E)XK motif protein [Nocardia vermiculata]|uniref:PD-(D/E)XK motif protein n=1 Tax=Nocardia vermiculata TaxID=257274 RepID=A0A846Y438_9NOCA|nr:PD-(D/E)XK motif protein [Nocardia vermiculata]NKY52038.1 PD-(D/E)XK motif protein [Nocardia vermiculata]
MTDPALRTILDDYWDRLERDRPSSGHALQTAPLPVVTSAGPLLAAVDSDGHRHLLVPVDPHHSVRRGLNGPVLELRRRILEDEHVRSTFADLGCLRSDLNDVFAVLCADVLLAVETAPAQPVKILNRVLDHWKALFQNPGTPLGAKQIAGLFGELVVLRRLLELDPSAHRLWRGPVGHRHDFSAELNAIEVKTSMAAESREIRIHGLSQLEPPLGGTLALVWLRLEAAVVGGTGVKELIDEVLRLCDDEGAVIIALAAIGYRVAHDDHYRHIRFGLNEERWYRVDDEFPRLTSAHTAAAGVSESVFGIDYSISLAGETPEPMDDDSIKSQLTAIAEELR